MPSTLDTILELANPYHAYVFGTAFWYSLRAFMRVTDPGMVCDWFRPPVDGKRVPNDLELYTTWTDSFSLFALALLLLVLSEAVPLPANLVGSTLASPTPSSSSSTSSTGSAARKPYARAALLVTLLHHGATGYGAWTHWRHESHANVAMAIGVWGNVGLVALGAAALWYLGNLQAEGGKAGSAGGKRAKRA